MVITCILASRNENTRRDAVSKVLAIRKRPEEQDKSKKMKAKKRKTMTKAGIRKLRVPKLNFNADYIHELCTWDDATEPAITLGVPDEELFKYLETPLSLDVPCHTQSVEREVRLTTESSAAVSGIGSQERHQVKLKIHFAKLAADYAYWTHSVNRSEWRSYLQGHLDMLHNYNVFNPFFY